MNRSGQKQSNTGSTHRSGPYSGEKTSGGEKQFSKNRNNTGVAQKKAQQFLEKQFIPLGSAPFIIGKSGANVKRILQDTNAKCTVKDTVVFINAANKQHIAPAKKMILDLVRSYLSRKQAQINSFNLVCANPDASGDDIQEWTEEGFVQWEDYDGPLTAFETQGNEKRYFCLKLVQSQGKESSEEKEQEEEEVHHDTIDEEDEDQLYELAKISFKKPVSGTARRRGEIEDSSPLSGGSSFETSDENPLQFVNNEILKEQILSTLIERLMEQKQKQLKEEIDFSFAVEALLGRKLFFLNQTTGKKKEEQKLENSSLQQFLQTKVGFGQKLNSIFNSALTRGELTKLEDILKTKPLVSDKMHIYLTTMVNTGKAEPKKFIYECYVDLTGVKDTSAPLPIKMSTQSERNQKIMVVDVVSALKPFDFRIRAKAFPANLIVFEEVSKFIENNLSYDLNNHSLVLKPSEEVKENPYQLEYRRKREKIYQDGPFKLIWREKEEEEVIDASQSKKKKQKKKEEEETEETKPQETSTTTQEETKPQEAVAVEEEPEPSVPKRKMQVLEFLAHSDEVDQFGDANSVPKKKKEDVTIELPEIQKWSAETVSTKLMDLIQFLEKNFVGTK